MIRGDGGGEREKRKRRKFSHLGKTLGKKRAVLAAEVGKKWENSEKKQQQINIYFKKNTNT